MNDWKGDRGHFLTLMMVFNTLIGLNYKDTNTCHKVMDDIPIICTFH